jgi:hypothetical protein
MISSKYLGIMAVVAMIGAAGLCPKSAPAAESVPGDQSLIENEGASSEGATVPRSPLRLSTVDYVDTSGGSGKLTVAGIALPGKELYLFLDDEPLAKAVPDDGGKWSVESEMKLDEGRHTLRADQYDAATTMLAARAIVSIERAKPGSGEAPESSPPKATTP